MQGEPLLFCGRNIRIRMSVIYVQISNNEDRVTKCIIKKRNSHNNNYIIFLSRSTSFDKIAR